MWTPRGGSVDVGDLRATPGRGCVARSNPDADAVEKIASGITGCSNWITVGLADGRRLTGIL